jgi:hypothetical protein
MEAAFQSAQPRIKVGRIVRQRVEMVPIRPNNSGRTSAVERWTIASAVTAIVTKS